MKQIWILLQFRLAPCGAVDKLPIEGNNFGSLSRAVALLQLSKVITEDTFASTPVLSPTAFVFVDPFVSRFFASSRRHRLRLSRAEYKLRFTARLERKIMRDQPTSCGCCHDTAASVLALFAPFCSRSGGILSLSFLSLAARACLVISPCLLHSET